MPSATFIVSVLAGIVAIAAAAVYFFGIPLEIKRKMEKAALENMGENKASYLMKDQISKLPASDQKEARDMQKGLGNVLGGALQNPLGKQAGETGDKATSPLTGR